MIKSLDCVPWQQKDIHPVNCVWTMYCLREILTGHVIEGIGVFNYVCGDVVFRSVYALDSVTCNAYAVGPR